MASKMMESDGSPQSEVKSGQPDFKWAVEWLVRREGNAERRRSSE